MINQLDAVQPIEGITIFRVRYPSRVTITQFPLVSVVLMQAEN